VVILFLRLSLGGPLLGAAFGMALSLFIKRVFDDSVLETALTFVTCYLLFWTAETSGLHVSGILALVALGLYMSGWGKTYIWSSSEEKVHAFWSFIGWSGETLIFLLSGVIIGNEVILNQSISAEDWGKLFLFFILIMIIRALVVFLFLPVLRRWGYGLSFAESLVLIYGGLRGAVGLALALIVYHNDDIDTHTRELVLFHTAGIATLTLLVNGTTTGIVVDTLGLARSSKV
jgi:NhaP-type Na+/H+ or K+/H+ antiporter